MFDVNQSRPRPIIAKFRCIWDRRLVLNTRKLAEVTAFQGTGIAPGELSDIRRQRIMKRLHDKSRARGEVVFFS